MARQEAASSGHTAGEMAQPTLADEVTEAVSWCVEHEGSQGLSYVFKINRIHLDNIDQTICWQDYTREPNDPDIKSLTKGVHTLFDVANQDDGQTPVEPGIRRSVCLLLAIVKKCAFEVFKAKQLAPEHIKWFMQAEYSIDQFFHVHLLVWGEPVKQIQGKWWQKALTNNWSRWLVASIGLTLSATTRLAIREKIEQEGWVDVLQYKHAGTRKEYCKMVNIVDIITNYFLLKDPWWLNKPSIYWCSFDADFKLDHLSYTQRKSVADLYRKYHTSDNEQPSTSSTKSNKVIVETMDAKQNKRARIETQKERNIKDTVQLLFDNRVITAEEWALFDPDSYVHIMTQPAGEMLIRNILDIVTLRMSKLLTAFDLVKERHTQDLDSIETTKVFDIFNRNHMNPYKVIHAIMCCLNRQSGKRNTILFWGPATTGKSILAQSLAYLVSNVGCYNPANVNFPFNDCTNKNIIWVEEASNFGQQVNQFKAICSGQTIRIDQKGKGSKTIAPTPVIMTTNENITEVRIGCESKPEHTQPIRDRMLNFKLTVPLPGDYGLIPTTEWANIFTWMVGHYYEPTMASYVHHWGHTPTWEENWADPPILTVQKATSLLSPITSKKPGEDTTTPPDLSDLLDAWKADEDLDSLQLFDHNQLVAEAAELPEDPENN